MINHMIETQNDLKIDCESPAGASALTQPQLHQPAHQPQDLLFLHKNPHKMFGRMANLAAE